MRFIRPVANGGRKIDWYQARCHRPGTTWQKARGSSSPITVRNLPKRRVYCQVRAHNVKGYGKWTTAVRSR